MLEDDKSYEIHILKQFINNYLDKTLSTNKEDALNTLLYKCDDLVWKIATEIYSQSGHKVEFSLVRDLATSRIEALKIAVEKQKAEQARLREIEEARKAEEEARRRAIEEARQAEEAQRRVQEQAQRKVIEEVRSVKKQVLKAQTEAQGKAIEEALQAEDKARFVESGGDIYMFELFLKIKKVIIEQLEVEPDRVTLDRVISNSSISTTDAYLDIIEFVMVLEEELDIEIPDEIMEHHTTALCGSYTINIRELLYSIYAQSLLQK
ncbi:MAG: hypothetical protein AB4368_24910 [Xenococcaceae cyanobacterium]